MWLNVVESYKINTISTQQKPCMEKNQSSAIWKSSNNYTKNHEYVAGWETNFKPAWL